MAARMADPPVNLNPAARRVVEQAIRDHCEHRNWWLGAANVRTNHVHCVIGAAGVDPGEVVRQLKSWATRRLREAGFAGNGRVWTHHGSTRYLFERRFVDLAMQYTLEEQSGARFDAWLETRMDG
jgi:REP element-mobilizing transposase RayT